MSEKIKISLPVIVEGKYDKIKLDSLFDANIITTGGFELFNDSEKLLLIKRLASKSKIIILTDSDGAGHLIRSHIKTALKQIIEIILIQITILHLSIEILNGETMVIFM